MNRKEIAKLISEEMSGERALKSATHMTDFYRSPGAAGYHRATDFVADLFRENGLDKIWVERYPLDGETKFVTQSMPLAWDPISAEAAGRFAPGTTPGFLREGPLLPPLVDSLHSRRRRYFGPH